MIFPRYRPFRRLPVALLAVFALLAQPVPATAQAASPRAAVEALHAVLLDGMKRADTLGIEGRFKLFEPVVTRSFNHQRMIAIACGSYWRKASEEERGRLVAAFSRFSVATYANQFSSWSGESFSTAGTRQGPGSTVLVDTRILRPNGEDPVRLNYVVLKSGDGWQIVDVLLDGDISELARKRSEFRSSLAAGGVPALVKSLNARADRLLAGKG